jgi:hypothetical protein
MQALSPRQDDGRRIVCSSRSLARKVFALIKMMRPMVEKMTTLLIFYGANSLRDHPCKSGAH